MYCVRIDAYEFNGDEARVLETSLDEFNTLKEAKDFASDWSVFYENLVNSQWVIMRIWTYDENGKMVDVEV